MSQSREKSGSQKKNDRQHRRPPEHGGGSMTEDRPDRPSSNPSRKDRSRTTPANETQVWNGDIDDEFDVAGEDRDEAGTRRRADEDDEK